MALLIGWVGHSQNKVVTNDSIFSQTIFNINDTVYVVMDDHFGAGKGRLWRLSENLTIFDTINLGSKGSDTVYCNDKIQKNNDVLIYNGKVKNGTYLRYIQKLENGRLSDSVYMDLDSIKGGLVDRIYYVDSTKIVAPVIKSWPPGSFPRNSVIAEMDSNFVMIDYHTIDFAQPGIFFNSGVIISISFLEDSVWHIHGRKGELYTYNPVKHKTMKGKSVVGTIQSYYKIKPNEYLGFGTAARLTIKGQPASAEELLGFYRINTEGDIIDTASFTFIVDSSLFSIGRLEFAESETDVANAVIIDTNNIYLAADASFRDDNFKLIKYIYVVKTDSQGNKHWEYVWESPLSECLFRGIVPTSDGGCIVSGIYLYQGPLHYTNLILIKLGPDGNITNVEFSAPETVISFYPNPIKDKLHYSLLPEANGPYTLEVVDMQGKPVMESYLSGEESSIPVNLQTGFYPYQLKSEDGKVEQVGKLVVE